MKKDKTDWGTNIKMLGKGHLHDPDFDRYEIEWLKSISLEEKLQAVFMLSEDMEEMYENTKNIGKTYKSSINRK